MFMMNRLLELMKKDHRSARYMSEQAGMSAGYIKDLKAHSSEPSEHAISIWAEILHTTPAYLLGETDDPSEGIKKEPAGLEADGLSDEDRELIEAFRAAPPEKRRAILELLK